MSIFSSVPITKLSRSTFNLSHENKCSFDFGGLYPILTHTVLPGDKMSLGLQSFIRTVPLLSPVMHRNDIKVDSFFVPFRLIWENYEQWLQCSDNSIHMPLIKCANNITVGFYNTYCSAGKLSDYLGYASVPSGAFTLSGSGDTAQMTNASVRQFNLLPFRAYQWIYDFYYRNKSVEASIFDNGGGSFLYDNYDVTFTSTNINIPDIMKLRYRPWRRDPFTSALPNPQKGNPIAMPTGDVVASKTGSNFDPFAFQRIDGAASANGNPSVSSGNLLDSNGNGMAYKSGLTIDAPTIEDLRYAEVLEEYEEALARSGAGSVGSFKEWLLSIWRTLSPDSRLDRPEYLGGYRGPIQISEVPQTSESTVTSSQGTLAGKGLSVGGQMLFKNKTFKEPGYLMVIMSVVPKSGYFQGDPREFLYKSCYDFPNPYFANLGEQEVYAQEINATQALLNSLQQQTFGYNVRNYEMKQLPDTVHGALRTSLLYWHEARKFEDVRTTGADVVNLNKAFTHVDPAEVNRIFPVLQSSDKLIGEFFFDFKAKRSLPYYGVPRIGHSK